MPPLTGTSASSIQHFPDSTAFFDLKYRRVYLRPPHVSRPGGYSNGIDYGLELDVVEHELAIARNFSGGHLCRLTSKEIIQQTAWLN